MRSYALVILNNQDRIIDRFPLDFVTEPKGNGFTLDISKISTSGEDVVTKITHKKGLITFNINQVGSSYQKSKVLARWLQKYSRIEYTMALEYNDNSIQGQKPRYINGFVSKLTKDEKVLPMLLIQSFEFTTLGAYYEKKDAPITVQYATYGKKASYYYPYRYGFNTVTNNKITNEYLEDIPIIIIIQGLINKPYVELLDENGVSYNKIQMTTDVELGETLVINSAKKKVFKINSKGQEIDVVNEVDPQFDTFLKAKVGISTLNLNLSDAGEGFKLNGVWRQYEL